MHPRDLQPSEVLAPLTPMGRQPMNRWEVYGAGGGPYEPRGFYPSVPGNRLAPGYDGLSASELWDRAARAAIVVPPERPVMAEQRRASASPPRRRRRKLVAPLVPLAEDTTEESSAGGGAFNPVLLVIGIGLGIGLAYIAYDEGFGTGAALRRGR